MSILDQIRLEQACRDLRGAMAGFERLRANHDLFRQALQDTLARHGATCLCDQCIDIRQVLRQAGVK